MATFEPLPGLVLATVRALGVVDHPVLVAAVSGGRDSRVLLHAAAAAWPAHALVVAHVNHGLHPQADDWQAFCEQLAAQSGLRFVARRLPPRDEPGIEAWARRHRYRALADIASGVGSSVVLTAHHANDQLETAQMRRIRGAGPLGLGGMRVVSPLPDHPGLRLVRPFLSIGRSTLDTYARQHRLHWIEDPSNRDPKHLRNQVRATLDAAIARDAGALERGLAAVDAMQRDADALRRMAETDLESARLRLYLTPDEAAAGGVNLGRSGGAAGSPVVAGEFLSRAALARLPADRAAEALRAWLAAVGCRMPSRAKLAEIRRQLVDASAAECRLLHDGRWLLRYRDRIVARISLPVPVKPTWFRWQGESRLTVAGNSLEFRLIQPFDLGVGGMIRGLPVARLRDRDLLLDHGQRADRLRIQPNGPLRTWRNLVQERGIPRWLRLAMPVIRTAEGGLLHAAPFGSDQSDTGEDFGFDGEPSVQIRWDPPPDLAAWV